MSDEERLNTLEIDYELEEFYTNFKQSMKNFYSDHSFKRPLEEWSSKLNNLKKNKKYSEIQGCIINIISLYAIDLMRTGDSYNGGILITNIKRFNRISIKNTIIQKIDFNTNLVFLLLNIFTYLCKRRDENVNKLFNQIELYLIYEDFTDLIEYSIENNCLSILDKLFCYSNSIFEKAKKMYNVETNHKIISSSKFKLLIDKKLNQ
jgi:hypothetical protein